MPWTRNCACNFIEPARLFRDSRRGTFFPLYNKQLSLSSCTIFFPRRSSQGGKWATPCVQKRKLASHEWLQTWWHDCACVEPEWRHLQAKCFANCFEAIDSKNKIEPQYFVQEKPSFGCFFSPFRRSSLSSMLLSRRCMLTSMPMRWMRLSIFRYAMC